MLPRAHQEQPAKKNCLQPNESKGEMEKFSYKSEYIEHFTRVASLHFLIFGEDLELQRCHRKEVSSSGTFQLRSSDLKLGGKLKK